MRCLQGVVSVFGGPMGRLERSDHGRHAVLLRISSIMCTKQPHQSGHPLAWPARGTRSQILGTRAEAARLAPVSFSVELVVATV